jgi:ubiquinone biosynthesis protein UbiJ
MLSEASIDWEELLSNIVGDIPAYQAGSTVRKGNEWVSETVDAMKSNVAEYLSEESRVVPAKAEVNQFMEDVDDLRMASDRLEARLKLLEANHAGDSSAK